MPAWGVYTKYVVYFHVTYDLYVATPGGSDWTIEWLWCWVEETFEAYECHQVGHYCQ